MVVEFKTVFNSSHRFYEESKVNVDIKYVIFEILISFKMPLLWRQQNIIYVYFDKPYVKLCLFVSYITCVMRKRNSDSSMYFVKTTIPLSIFLTYVCVNVT